MTPKTQPLEEMPKKTLISFCTHPPHASKYSAQLMTLNRTSHLSIHKLESTFLIVNKSSYVFEPISLVSAENVQKIGISFSVGRLSLLI